MKKILFFISSLILFISVAYADVEYSEWVTELDPNIEYEDIIEEKRYRFYKEKEIGEYVSVNKDTSNIYKYTNIEDYIISDFSNWVNKCDPNLTYEKKEYALVYPYQKIADTSYIHLYEFANNVGFNDIKVYSNGEEVGYELLPCDNCAKDYSFINKGEKLLLKLDRNIETSTLTFYIEGNSSYPNVIYRFVGSVDVVASFKTFNRVINSNLKNFFLDSVAIRNATKTEMLYSTEEILEDDYTTVFEAKAMCRYKERLTYRYDIIKEYYDDNYYVNLPEYIKDEEDYKIYYRYLIKETLPNVDNDKINSDESNENAEDDVSNDDNGENNKESDSGNDVIDNSNENKQDIELEIIESENNNLQVDEDDNITYKESFYNEDEDNKESNEVEENTEDKDIEIGEDNKEISNKTDLVTTMKIDTKKTFIKYIILVVILITIIFIYYQNKKCVERK